MPIFGFPQRAGVPRPPKPGPFGRGDVEGIVSPDASGMTPFRRALQTTRSDATSRAFDAAKMHARERAQASGMDYSQPIEQANEAMIGSEQARAIGAIPMEAQIAAAPLELQAAQLQNQKSEQSARRKSSIFGGLAKAGLGVAAGFGASAMPNVNSVTSKLGLGKPQSRIRKVFGGISRGLGF